jgi:hypothetical protein
MIMRRIVCFLTASVAFAQAHKPFQSQTPATVNYTIQDGQEHVDITNVAYEVTSTNVPGRPADERLLLRTTTRTKQAIGDIGMEAATTIEAWPLGADLKQKPLYALKVEGVDAKTLDAALITVERGLEEEDWWSVYRLGSGAHLFDTYTPLLAFSIRRDTLTQRYVGYENPGDDVADKRLKDPHVIGVITYASPERVLHEALITSDDPKQAVLLRSFADASRTLTVSDLPSQALKLVISQNYPSSPAPVTLTIPIAHDDLDLAHATLPAHVHLAAFKR